MALTHATMVLAEKDWAQRVKLDMVEFYKHHSCGIYFFYTAATCVFFHLLLSITLL